MARTFRWQLFDMRGVERCQVTGITHDQSVVMVSAAEGAEASGTRTTNSPLRFIGDARIWVENVAPARDGLWFNLVVDWPDPLTVWVDIVVFDEHPSEIRTIRD